MPSWSSGISLIGPQGSPGLSVLTGSGVPASSLGASGQAYVDTTNAVLYLKGASAWGTGVPLVGPQGPSGAALRNGTGAPSSTNPATQNDGDFYIQNDASPPALFGPRAGGVWPTTSVSTGGTIIRTTSGPPAATLGNIGDYAIDRANALFYGPKDANGWFDYTPVAISGPTGPSGQIQPALGGYVAAYGTSVQMNGVTVGTTGVQFNYNGVTIPSSFIAQTNQALVGLTAVNFSTTGATIYPYLYDMTAGSTVYQVGGSSGIGSGTVNNYTFANTAYPLTAGHQYAWMLTRSASGSVTAQIVPQYLVAASGGQSVSTLPNQVISSASLGTTAQILSYPGMAGQVGYYYNALPSYLYSCSITVYGAANASAVLSLYNSTTSATIYTAPSITASQTPTPQFSGPFGVNTAYIPANNQCYWRITGTGTASANVVFQVCQ